MSRRRTNPLAGLLGALVVFAGCNALFSKESKPPTAPQTAPLPVVRPHYAQTTAYPRPAPKQTLSRQEIRRRKRAAARLRAQQERAAEREAERAAAIATRQFEESLRAQDAQHMRQWQAPQAPPPSYGHRRRTVKRSTSPIPGTSTTGAGAGTSEGQARLYHCQRRRPGTARVLIAFEAVARNRRKVARRVEGLGVRAEVFASALFHVSEIYFHTPLKSIDV